MFSLKTLRSKVLASNLVLYLVLLISFVVVYEISISSLRNVTVALMEESVQKDALRINGILEQTEKIGLLIANESEIQQTLRKELPANQRDVYKQRIAFNYKLNSMKKYMSSIDGVFVVGVNGAIFRSSAKSLKSKDYTQQAWFQEMIATKTPVWLGPDQRSLMVRNLDHKTMSYLLPIMDKASYEVLGVVVVEVFSSQLAEVFDRAFLDQGTLVMTNDTGEIIYPNNQTISNPPQMIDPIHLPKGNPEFSIESSLNVNGWKLIAYIPEEIIFKDLNQVRNKILLVFALMSFLALGIGWVFALKMSQPIKAMQQNMKSVMQGNFDVTLLKIESADELGELSFHFNQMVATIKTLMNHQRKQQEQLEKAELKALQSQINPHFLYNTLDSINWMARMNQTNEVSEMIQALTKIFRVTLSRGETLIPIREELVHVTEYMKIQQYRYGKSLDFQVSIDPQLDDYLIVKLVLQPLVENALYHGIESTKGIRRIHITAYDQGMDILFVVENTGHPITEQKRLELQQLLNSETDTGNQSYGLVNVQRRLLMHFGKPYGITFPPVEADLVNHENPSAPQMTRVFIRIPKQQEP